MREAERAGKRPAWAELAYFGAIAGSLAAVLASLAFTVGVTVDEPSHLVSAHLYWRGERLEPGHVPPLIYIVGGWVPDWAGLRLPPRSNQAWKTNHEWNVALETMGGLSGAEIRRIFGWSRLPMILFPVACAAVLWLWGRLLFSPRAGLIAAAFFSMSPLILGHGMLFKNDLAAAFGFLLFWFLAWRFWSDPSPRRVAWMAAGLLVATLAKYSMMVLAPAAFLMLAVRVPARGLAATVKSFAVSIGILLAGWQFTFQPAFESLKSTDLDAWKADRALPAWTAGTAKTANSYGVPAQLIRGAVSLAQSNSEGVGVYLLGRVWPLGHPAYFLVALAVKLSGALQILLAAGIAIAIAEAIRGRLCGLDAFWIVPPAAYLAIASLSSLQLGVRLVLPSVALGILFAALAADRLSGARWGRVALIALLGSMGARTVAAYPDYLAFFNLWSGGSARGLEYLSDSNLDWGQDLPALERWVEENRIPKIRLAYFGTDNPYGYLTDKRLESVAPPWSDDLVKSTRYEPEPGFYAVSATLLTGQLFQEKYRDYFGCFRRAKPIAKAGYSIWIYEVR